MTKVRLQPSGFVWSFPSLCTRWRNPNPIFLRCNRATLLRMHNKAVHTWRGVLAIVKMLLGPTSIVRGAPPLLAFRHYWSQCYVFLVEAWSFYSLFITKMREGDISMSNGLQKTFIKFLDHGSTPTFWFLFFFLLH